MTHTEERTGVPPALSEAERVFCNFVRSGTEVDRDRFEELCAEHPEQEAELRQLLFNWNKVSAILAQLDRSPEFADRLRAKYGDAIDPGISLDKSATDGPTRAMSDEGSLIGRFTGDRSPVRRYVYREEVARGGMGAILRIWDKDLRRTLAMKVMLGTGVELPGSDTPVDERMLSRFLEEAQITGQLDHPGIVPVHELGLDAEGRVYFTMRYVRGEDLKQILDRVNAGEGGEWSQIRLLGVVQRICEAVAFAHSKGVVHRDLKPANVMVGRFGETYVMDWGLARVLGRAERPEQRPRTKEELSVSIVQTDRGDGRSQEPDSPLITLDGDVVGTPSYMSPEQAMGKLEEVGPASDIYAVGSILYHLLSGQVPYTTPGARVSPHTVLSRLLEGPPAPVEQLDADVPDELVAICNKAMAREAGERYGSMLELAEDLRAFMEGRVVSAYETGAVAEFKKWVARNRGMAASIAALVIVALCALGAVLFVQIRARQDQERRNQELAALNADLEALNLEKEELAAAERNSAEEAREQRDLAEHNAELSRRRSYTAKILAAEASLPLNEIDRAKTLLASCEDDYRGWEWRNLSLRADSSLGTIELAPLRPRFLTFSPDGTQFVAGDASRLAAFFDVASLTELERVRPQNVWGTPPDFPDAIDREGRVAVGVHAASTNIWMRDATMTIVVWDLQRRRTLRHEIPPPSGSSEDAEPRAAAVSPDARTVAVAWHRDVQIWNLEPWELQRKFSIEARPDQLEERTPRFDIDTMTFTADGEAIVVAFAPARDREDSDNPIQVHDASNGELLQHFPGHDGPVTALAVAPEEPWVASASQDRTARLWDLETGELRATLVGHDAAVTAVAFDAQGKRLLTGSADNTARVWFARTGGQVARLVGHEAPLLSVASSADGKLLATSSIDGAVKLWDPLIASPFTPLKLALTFAVDGRTTRAATFSSDASQVLTGDSAGSIWRWDSRSGTPASRLDEHEAWVCDIAIAPDAATFSTCDGDQQLVIWDALRDVPLHRHDMGRRRATELDYSPDAKRLAVACQDRNVHVYDVESGERVGTFSDHPHPLKTVDWGPANRAASVCRRQALVWDPTTFELVAVLGPDLEDRANVARFSPDGATIAVGYESGAVRLWGPDGEALGALPGDDESIHQLSFDAAGTRLVGGRNDGTVRFWDPNWGEFLHELGCFEAPISALEFDPTGERLLAVPGSQIVRDTGEAPRIWETSAPAERRVAVRTAKAISDRVQPLVHDLFEQAWFLDDVQRLLAIRSDLSDAERTTALRMASFLGDRPAFLHTRARQKLEEDPAVAVRLARRATEVDDGNEYRLTLARALYHADRAEESSEVLAAVEEYLADRRPLPDSAADELRMTQLYRALCDVALDLADAEQSLEVVRSDLEENGLPSDETLLAVLAELDRVTGGAVLPEPIEADEPGESSDD